MSKECDDKEFRKILDKVFDSFDTDKSGHLDRKELHAVLSKFYKEKGVKKDAAFIDQQCKDLMASLDDNKDGTVSKKEFIDAVMERL